MPSVIPSEIPASAGDLGTEALSPVMYLNLGCRASFDGRLDAEVLERAVRLTLDAEPVLGCGVGRHIGGKVWRRCADLDGAPPFALLVTGDPDHRAVAFHDEAFADGAPRLAVRLLRSTYGDELCLKVDHRVADGRAAKEIFYLLADTYTRVLADPAWVPQPDLAPRPTYEDLWAALTDAQRAAAVSAPRFAASRWRIPLHGGDAEGLRSGTLTVFPAGLRAVKAYGTARGATVNDMLVTALLRSIARTSPPADGIPLCVSITADLRRFAPSPRFDRACNLSSAQSVEVPRDAGESFDDSLRRVMEAVEPWKRGLWGFHALLRPGLPAPVVRVLMSAVIAYAGRHSLVPPTIMNIGVLDESRMDFGDLRPTTAQMLGPVLRAPGFAAVVSTYRDTLTVWMGFREEHVAQELVDRALRGMDEELRAAVWSAEPTQALGERSEPEAWGSTVRVRRATGSSSQRGSIRR